MGGILTILFVAVVIFAAFKLLPPYINNYQLQDSLDAIARNSTYAPRITEADIRKQVIEEAREIGVDLEPDQVAVTKAGVNVSISTSYVITVDLLYRDLDLEFAPSAGNRNIMAR